MKIVPTLLPKDSWLIRIHDKDDQYYDRMIVVTESINGSNLYLQGWTGTPLTHGEWREYASKLFPSAKTVSFERLRKDGSFRYVKLNLE